MSLLRIATLLTIPFLVSTASISSAGAIQNGGFSSGLVEWNTVGDAAVVDESAIITNSSTIGDDPLGVTYNFSGYDPVSVTNLESFLGVSPGFLSPSNSLFGAIEGSLISQKFSANSGDILSFDWRFLTNDSAVEIIPGFLDADYAFVAIAGNNFFQLDVLSTSGSTLLSPTSDPSVVFQKSTPLSSYSLKLPSTSLYTLSFGVVDVGGSANTSALLIDNVKLEQTKAVPEPSLTAAILLLSGLGVVGAVVRKQ